MSKLLILISLVSFSCFLSLQHFPNYTFRSISMSSDQGALETVYVDRLGAGQYNYHFVI